MGAGLSADRQRRARVRAGPADARRPLRRRSLPPGGARRSRRRGLRVRRRGGAERLRVDLRLLGRRPGQRARTTTRRSPTSTTPCCPTARRSSPRWRSAGSRRAADSVWAVSKPPRVTAVVVTWNRKDLLREALWALKLQTTLIAPHRRRRQRLRRRHRRAAATTSSAASTSSRWRTTPAVPAASPSGSARALEGDADADLDDGRRHRPGARRAGGDARRPRDATPAARWRWSPPRWSGPTAATTR